MKAITPQGLSKRQRLNQAHVLAACALLMPLPALATANDPCASAHNTLEMNECIQRVLKEKDAELNRAYQALLRSLAPSPQADSPDYDPVKRKLAEAQRAWIAFRDADCNAKYTLWEQGSIRDAIYLSCLIEHTEHRTAQLRKWAEM